MERAVRFALVTFPVFVAMALSGCVTEEIPPPEIHTTAYVESANGTPASQIEQDAPVSNIEDPASASSSAAAPRNSLPLLAAPELPPRPPVVIP
jgi:hypothetical protein